jgi:uncharacterized DUF497 family protein
LVRVKNERDEAKNSNNQKKHGVSFEEAQNAFLDTSRIIRPDGYERDDAPKDVADAMDAARKAPALAADIRPK